MRSRGFAVCSMLALASIARAGATVQFAITPPVCPGEKLLAGTLYNVDVQLLQDAGGAEQRLRMVEFDMADTSALLTVVLPTTHDKGTPGGADDIKFWLYDSLSSCQSTPSFCGFNHYIDQTVAAGAVDTRTNVLTSAFHGLSVDNTAQVALPGGLTPAPVTVARFQMTPAIEGSVTLNLMNLDDTDPNRRARVDFGFDPHITWRAGNASPNNLSGGIRSFDVISGQQCPQTEVTYVSSIPNSVGQGEATVPAGGTLWKSTRNVMRLTFSGPLPSTPTAANIEIFQLQAGGIAGPNLAANFTFTIEGGNVLRIAETATTPSVLTHRSWFGIRNNGWAGVGAFSRHWPVQVGDSTGDNRVLQADVGFVASNVACVAGCGDQNRADISGDSRVLQADAGEAASRVSSLPVAKPAGW